jgi:hypothetical protein
VGDIIELSDRKALGLVGKIELYIEPVKVSKPSKRKKAAK